MLLKRMQQQGALPTHIGGVVLCVAMLLVGWWVGLGPMLNQSQKLLSVVEEAEQAEQEAKNAKAGVDRLTEQLSAAQSELELKPVRLEPASQINTLLAQLAGWSETHRLNITRTQSGRPEALAYYDYVPIDLEGEGGYGDLMTFFTRLHEARGDLGLVGFSVKRMPQGGVSFELELAWYVIGQEQEQGENATPATASASATFSP